MTARPPAGQPSERIGPYKLLQVLGEGGFGCVYMAEQLEPVRRKVALKIIKLGMDTRQVIARFEAERQALAMMDHPNIAKVLDAGATDTGRPYFVMELVKGVPITEYCDTNNLSTKERLVLFMLACHAVQHAHQKGIIHRDIKPSNVMIAMHDGKPVPKVIDFGIAKAVDQKLTEKTVFTEMHQLIGTPEYMSPEQAEMTGLDIDTRSDIYSLGVLLYELLTGTTPFDPKELRAAGYGEIQRIIREVDPPKPSTRLSAMGEKVTDVAKRRSSEPRALTKVLQGDLDWIVMKCLEKDRTRRYESADGVAMDVLKYLCDEAVTASPPRVGYRVGKFVRRNRTAVIAGAAVVTALVLGVVTSTWFAWHEAKARSAAEQERDDALRARADFGVIMAHHGLNAALEEHTVRAINFAEHSLSVYQQLGMQSEPSAALVHCILGRLCINATYEGYRTSEGDYRTRAIDHFRNAIRVAKSLPLHRRLEPALGELRAAWLRNEFPADYLTAQSALEDSSYRLSGLVDTGDGERIYRELITETGAVGRSQVWALQLFCTFLHEKGRHEEACRVCREAVTHPDFTREDVGGGYTYLYLGRSLLSLGRSEEAEAALKQAFENDVNWTKGESATSLILLFEERGDANSAQLWRARLAALPPREE